MYIKERLELYKEKYYFELERKDSLNSGMVIPGGIIGFLLGIAGYFYQRVGMMEPGFWRGAVFVLIVINIITLIIAIAHLVIAYFNYVYKHMPTSKEMEKYWDTLKSYYDEHESAEGDLDSRFMTFLLDSYNTCDEINTNNNDRKSGLLFRANKAIIAAMLITAVTFIPLSYEDICKYGNDIISVFKVNEEVNIDEREETTIYTPTPTATTAERCEG